MQAIHTGQDPEQLNSKGVMSPISLSTTFKPNVPGKPVRNGRREEPVHCVMSVGNCSYSLPSKVSPSTIDTIPLTEETSGADEVHK